ncbi:MAG: hypothetical protein COU63_04390 [Candidatus Pacebacteria bacterium CG10_big_fil_rev_8_21_14_0_10_36_11]|nr:MAG: hypothetical protein AUK08_02665 [Candidatus Pacebacteria bacterium CG2_30_36_39]PIR64500.1 MAG: hypothetical protein COU63_04390 [Candidatus Pacebacteria bacterium CG10_big_fil_rev_8_21_14_0_10_36_11]PJC42989.1 MAG: hypothetical protein CO040_01595 [Candidatus Pacebacteria bacterium CG_4_9_14_0_2_um_filter_36_8]
MGINLQRLMLSYIFYLMARPLLDVFMSAFLWRQANGAILVIMYYLGWVLGLPVGFLINGFLLKKIHVKNLYFFGVVFQGAGAALAVFSTVFSPFSILSYGFLFGLTASFFWANKNSLSYLLSKGKDRMYYNSIESSLRLVVGVVVPVIVGWFLALGETISFYSVASAYKIMIVIALFLLFVSGLLMKFSAFEDIGSAQLWVTKKSKNWSMARAINFIYSCLMGINLFYPALLILNFGAKEGLLGTLQSVMQLLAAGSLYIAGRKMKDGHVLRFMNVAHLLYLITMSLLLWQFSWLFGLVYLMTQIILESVRWTNSYTLVMSAMDEELKGQNEHAGYAYVFDNEIFFNLGRAVGILSFLSVMAFSNLEFAMRWAPPIFILLQFFLYWPMKYLLERKAKRI